MTGIFSLALVALAPAALGSDVAPQPSEVTLSLCSGGPLTIPSGRQDQSPIIIGLGASAISSFPDLLVQNEKNSGRYRMMLSQNHLAPALGKRRTKDDQRRGAIIENLL